MPPQSTRCAEEALLGQEEAPHPQTQIKTQIVTGNRGEVLSTEPGYPGPTSDKSLDQSSAAAKEYPRAPRRGDLGCHGAAEMLVPHKGSTHETEKSRSLSCRSFLRGLLSQRRTNV